MRAETIEHRQVVRQAWPPRVLTTAGAAAFIVAAAWYGLAANGVTAAAAPSPAAGGTPGAALHAYYRWFATTLPQERLYTALAMAGFLCLGWAVTAARDWLGADRPLTRIGAALAGFGAALWITANLLTLGGHRAVGLMATHANPVQTVSSIAFTIDTSTEAVELGAFLLTGAGLLALAAASAGTSRPRATATGAGLRRADQVWPYLTVLTAVMLVVTGVSETAASGTLSQWALIVSGAVLLPAWLIVTGQLTTVAGRAA